jgi:hypothetical protein
LLNASVIDTYLPEDDDAAALSVWRSSTPEGRWFIRIDGMYDGDTHWPGPAFDECALKLVTALDQFPSYLKRSWWRDDWPWATNFGNLIHEWATHHDPERPLGLRELRDRFRSHGGRPYRC